MIQVNYIDNTGESCWAEFSSSQAAIEYCGIENIISWEHYWGPLSDEFEDDFQPDEYTEWQDYYGGDDWDHGQYDEY